MLSALGRRRTTLLGSVALVAALSAGCFSATATAPTPEPVWMTGHAQELAALANQARADHGLAPLAWDGQLAGLAVEWSWTMGVNAAFVHRDLQSTIEQPEFARFARLDENILLGYCSNSPAEMHAAWMNSAGHAGNILAPEADVVGIGVLCGTDGRAWATQNFGRLRD